MEIEPFEAYKSALESQIRDAFGKVVYSQTCHLKMAERLIISNNRWKVCQLILSALISCSVVAALFDNSYWSNIISVLLSALLTMINLYLKNFNLAEDAEKHQQSANELWKIREEYISLLIELKLFTNMLDVGDIIKKRDELQERTLNVYKNSLKTDNKSYQEAQQALKIDEEQTFFDQEVDIMLPISLRKNNKDIHGENE